MARLPTFRDPCANPSTSFRFGPPGPGAALPCLSRIPIRCQRENQRKPWASTYFRALTPNPEEARGFPMARLRRPAIRVPTLHFSTIWTSRTRRRIALPIAYPGTLPARKPAKTLGVHLFLRPYSQP